LVCGFSFVLSPSSISLIIYFSPSCPYNSFFSCNYFCLTSSSVTSKRCSFLNTVSKTFWFIRCSIQKKSHHLTTTQWGRKWFQHFWMNT
jgi:hypothetical protein